MLDCVLIARNEAFRHQVLELVGRADSNAQLSMDLTQSAETLSREAVGRVVASVPAVAFLDLGESTTGLRVVKALGEDAPEVAVLVSGPPLSAEDLLEVMRGGAAEYLPQPLAEGDVAAAFGRLRRRLGTSAPSPESRGRVIGVCSAKGGTGVTTLASNLAVVVARRTGDPTLLLDLNPGFGAADLHLGLQPRYSYLDAAESFHRMDSELFESFLEDHESGVSLLAAPSTPASSGGLTPDQAVTLIRLGRRQFAHVVVDVGRVLPGFAASVLGECDDILLVANPDVATLRNLKRARDRIGLRSLGGSEGLRVVLNQDREGTGVARRDVEEILGVRVFATLDFDDDTVVRGLNLGSPVGESGRSRFAKGMARLGDALLGTNGKQGGGRLSFLRPFRSSSSSK